MNQQLNHQPTTHNASYAVQPQRFSFSWPYRLGLMALTLIGLLLVSPFVFDTSVANAMSMTNHELNHSGPGMFEVAAQQLVRPTPTPTATSAEKITTADEPVKTDELVKADEPVKAEDIVKTDEPVKADEPVKTGDTLGLGGVAPSNTISGESADGSPATTGEESVTGTSDTSAGESETGASDTRTGIAAETPVEESVAVQVPATEEPVEENVAVQAPAGTSAEPIAPTKP